MNVMTELVDLPDPAVQPLVHPLDLPQARRPMRLAWWTGALTSCRTGLFAGVALWFATGGYALPAVVTVIIVGVGPCARAAADKQAWAYIPRRRQDRDRPAPAAWEFATELVLGSALAAAIVLITIRLDRPGVDLDVRQVTLGMGAGAIALTVLGAAVALTGRDAASRRQSLRQLPGIAALLASLGIGYGVLIGASTAGLSLASALGAGGTLAAVAIASGCRWAVRRYASHRAPDPDVS